MSAREALVILMRAQRAEDLLYCGAVIGTTPTRLNANGANRANWANSYE